MPLPPFLLLQGDEELARMSEGGNKLAADPGAVGYASLPLTALPSPEIQFSRARV